MPNQADNIVLELTDLAINLGPTYSYSAITGIDSNRSHSAQLQVLFFFTNFQNGQPVTNYTWENWYDPYVLPINIDINTGVLRYDQSTKTVTITNTDLVEKTDANGTSGLFPPTFVSGDSVSIIRSQNITKPEHTFGAGTRITSTALNNAFGQVFNSLQELEDRLLKLESE